MKKIHSKNYILLFMITGIINVIPAQGLSQKESDKTENGKPGIEELSQNVKINTDLLWDQKKFSIGAGIYSGLVLDTQGHFLNMANLNMRLWLSPNYAISFHHWIITNYLDNYSPSVKGNLHSLNIISLNFGYRQKIQNLHWFMDGGGGIHIPAKPERGTHEDCGSNPNCTLTVLYDKITPVININAGMEWLVLKNYALGFMVTAATTFSDFALFITLTANIVL